MCVCVCVILKKPIVTFPVYLLPNISVGLAFRVQQRHMMTLMFNPREETLPQFYERVIRAEDEALCEDDLHEVVTQVVDARRAFQRTTYFRFWFCSPLKIVACATSRATLFCSSIVPLWRKFFMLLEMYVVCMFFICRPDLQVVCYLLGFSLSYGVILVSYLELLVYKIVVDRMFGEHMRRAVAEWDKLALSDEYISFYPFDRWRRGLPMFRAILCTFFDVTGLFYEPEQQ
jgi:hypothetical protein